MKLLILFFLPHKCAADIGVTGPLLQTKAKEIAHGLHSEGFQVSNRWLERFRTRKNIKFPTSFW
jgi:hypothetical protein